MDGTSPAVSPDAPGPPAYEMHVLGNFDLLADGRRVRFPHHLQALLVLLACRGPCTREELTADLWPSAHPGRAAANLRTALSSLRRNPRLLVVVDDVVDLGTVSVDLAREQVSALQVIRRDGGSWQRAHHQGQLMRDLLPLWSKPWLEVTRSHFRHLRLRALEVGAELLAEEGRLAESVCVALDVVDADPFRESAQRVLLRGYLAEGNVVEAVRQLERFRRLLQDELGRGPSPSLYKLINSHWDG